MTTLTYTPPLPPLYERGLAIVNPGIDMMLSVLASLSDKRTRRRIPAFVVLMTFVVMCLFAGFGGSIGNAGRSAMHDRNSQASVSGTPAISPVAADRADSVTATSATPDTYVVEPGNTLSTIAASLNDGNTWQSLCGRNQPLIRDCDTIEPGWTLRTTGTIKPLPTPELTERERWIQAAEAVASRGGEWSNQGIAMAELIRDGFSPVQAAGFVGNFMVESGVNPSQFQHNGGPGRGIAQWEGGRRTTLFDTASSLRRPWDDLGFQLDFVVWELNNTETHARNMVMTAANTTQAAVLVRKFYERPSIYHDDRRIAHANALYGVFEEELSRV